MFLHYSACVLWKYLEDTQHPMHKTIVYEQVYIMQFVEKGFDLKQ